MSTLLQPYSWDVQRRAEPSMSRSALAIVVVGLITVPVATWWIVGDQSYKSSPQEGHVELDYMLRPLPLSGALERLVGIAAVAMVAVALMMLVTHARHTHWNRRRCGPLIAAALAGMSCGYGWRVLTAGVIGANIGAGMMILFGGPLVVVLIGWTTTRLIAVSRVPAHRRDVE